jgi:hypothetical protein
VTRLLCSRGCSGEVRIIVEGDPLCDSRRALWLTEEAAASVDRSPEGQDAEERLDRNDESAVRDSADAPKVLP